jgi:hypothetical protein
MRPGHRHPIRAPLARIKATGGPLSFGQNDKSADHFDRPNCTSDSGLGWIDDDLVSERVKVIRCADDSMRTGA